MQLVVRRYNIDTLPDDRSKLESWLHLSFLQKEEELLKFEATENLGGKDVKSIPYKEEIYTQVHT